MKIYNKSLFLFTAMYFFAFFMLLFFTPNELLARPGGGQSYSDDSDYSSGSSDDDYDNDYDYNYDSDYNNESRAYSDTEKILAVIISILIILAIIAYKIYIKIKEKRDKIIILPNPTPKIHKTRAEKNTIAINELTAVDPNFSKTLFIDFVSSIFTKYHAWQGTKEIDNILKLNELNDELEFEKATNIYGKLRWMMEEDSSLKPIRKHLKSLIKQYEKKHWYNKSKISNEQIIESDIAEKIVNSESEFILKRKNLIKGKLNEIGILQQDLAEILGHRPNYMSELINGVRPFSRDDIVVLHRLFGIDFKDLIPQFLKSEVTNHIKLTLGKLRNDKVRLNIQDLETA